jgi:hypothetical protein
VTRAQPRAVDVQIEEQVEGRLHLLRFGNDVRHARLLITHAGDLAGAGGLAEERGEQVAGAGNVGLQLGLFEDPSLPAGTDGGLRLSGEPRFTERPFQLCGAPLALGLLEDAPRLLDGGAQGVRVGCRHGIVVRVLVRAGGVVVGMAMGVPVGMAMGANKAVAMRVAVRRVGTVRGLMPMGVSVMVAVDCAVKGFLEFRQAVLGVRVQ